MMIFGCVLKYASAQAHAQARGCSNWTLMKGLLEDIKETMVTKTEINNLITEMKSLQKRVGTLESKLGHSTEFQARLEVAKMYGDKYAQQKVADCVIDLVSYVPKTILPFQDANPHMQIVQTAHKVAEDMVRERAPIKFACALVRHIEITRREREVIKKLTPEQQLRATEIAKIKVAKLRSYSNKNSLSQQETPIDPNEQRLVDIIMDYESNIAETKLETLLDEYKKCIKKLGEDEAAAMKKGQKEMLVEDCDKEKEPFVFEDHWLNKADRLIRKDKDILGGEYLMLNRLRNYFELQKKTEKVNRLSTCAGPGLLILIYLSTPDSVFPRGSLRLHSCIEFDFIGCLNLFPKGSNAEKRGLDKLREVVGSIEVVENKCSLEGYSVSQLALRLHVLKTTLERCVQVRLQQEGKVSKIGRMFVPKSTVTDSQDLKTRYLIF